MRHINMEIFKSIYRCFVHRKEIDCIFREYSTTDRFLHPKDLLHFLQIELHENHADMQRVFKLVEKYERDQKARRKMYMTFDGFVRFMRSDETHIFRPSCTEIYQDMNQPLTNYFISTSHNTYLVGNQLVGESHLSAYSNALMRGCRCVEIDCWDGVDDEPVVYHGFTFTSKIPFKYVIHVIGQYAFQTSQYPLVLSLEDHCSVRQQEVLTHHLLNILGDKLLSASLPYHSSEVLPSPEDLKGKILIKHKKIDQVHLPSRVLHREASGGWDDEESTNEESDGKESTISILTVRMDQMKKHLRAKQQGKYPQIAPELLDLVIYTKSKKFVSFQHSQYAQKFCENNSIMEREAQQLARHSALEFIHHTMNFLTRIYPKGSRTSSSNLQPQEFWNVGAQMVALNFQTPGVQMDLQDGRFQDNGGCGYVLKPEFLCNSDWTFDPNHPPHHKRPFFLQIKVISGFLLPPSKFSKSNTANPIVTVDIYGVPDDRCSKKTQVQRNNAFNPQWNKTLEFSIKVPEVAMVRFCLDDHIPVIGKDFMGQYTLPLRCINKGYRHIPLLNRHGQKILPASLFVHVYYTDPSVSENAEGAVDVKMRVAEVFFCNPAEENRTGLTTLLWI
ncbi:PREDICTED: 1-phosphatidylinositol 4,5-bisphosphate phosphodiesterase zeta-1 [Nanorana parkeri]|uniref:1-phosphatidylinositol 4,5-bisphosphate phosphodiesterase zeta-1 n=1 Tax=Nanorana parkeri TaxID=125878 RepID=UPI0008541AEB|nr:PREDICTED: 1-phosphatidylinositol 4,5-bisphosphate phosphodiesterase zeta-1 [Nanorana parkeri]